MPIGGRSKLLDGAEMPGLQHGLPALTRLVVELRFGVGLSVRPDDEWGPYLLWAAPLLLLAEGLRDEAAAALRRVPEPPPDLMQELLSCLTATAAIGLGEHAAMRRAHRALKPCAGQLAGAGSGLLSLGPVDEHLARLEASGVR